MTARPAAIARARARGPRAFRAPLLVRLRRTALWLGLGGLFRHCLVAFGFVHVVLFDPESWSFEPWRSFWNWDRRAGEWVFSATLPIDRILTGIERFGRVARFMFPPHLWDSWQQWGEVLQGLGETLSMAFLGTILGALLGARNILPSYWIRFTARRGFDVIRALETLVLALIFIRTFGLGPLPWVLAIAVSEIGTFAKLFSKATETVSEKPVEGVRASSGSRLQQIRFAIMPQVNPVIFSILLHNFESNVRSGTILGIVGAGGIGFLLSDRIAAYEWDEAWMIIFPIIAMVDVIDWLWARIRSRIIGGWTGAK